MWANSECLRAGQCLLTLVVSSLLSLFYLLLYTVSTLDLRTSTMLCQSPTTIIQDPKGPSYRQYIARGICNMTPVYTHACPLKDSPHHVTTVLRPIRFYFVRHVNMASLLVNEWRKPSITVSAKTAVMAPETQSCQPFRNRLLY